MGFRKSKLRKWSQFRSFEKQMVRQAEMCRRELGEEHVKGEEEVYRGNT